MLDRAPFDLVSYVLLGSSALQWYGDGAPTWKQGKKKKAAKTSRQANRERGKLIKVLRRHGKGIKSTLQLADLLESCREDRRCLSAACPECSRDGAMDTKKTMNKFSAEVRGRAVRMVQDHQGDHASQWAAIASIASKIGCTAESLRRWLRQAERDAGMRPGATTDERERMKALERENRELRQANEILRKASAYFAQAELDRRFKP